MIGCWKIFAKLLIILQPSIKISGKAVTVLYPGAECQGLQPDSQELSGWERYSM